MGRPTKNNCEFFSHDAGMRNHRKVKALRNKFQNGYAIWNMLLEYLTGIDGNEFELSDIEFELMAGDFGFSVTEIRDVVNYCISLEMLFNKNGFVHSESLDERLAPVYEKRNRAKELSKKQLRKNGKYVADIPQDNGITVTEMPQSKVKESKVKETTIKPFTSNQIEINEKPFEKGKEYYLQFARRLFDKEDSEGQVKFEGISMQTRKTITKSMVTDFHANLKVKGTVHKSFNEYTDHLRNYLLKK